MDEKLRDSALRYHREPAPGKITVRPTKGLTNQRDLALAYSPGVAYASLAIRDDPAEAATLTSRANLVGVITNGTAVLGLGDIGPLAAKPVMEGKGCLFRKFAGIDVFDIELAERDPDRFVEHVVALEPTLGGINLEDIKAPECFEIEARLRERLAIPVFHDDQHGTAIISAAALLNALKIVGKQLEHVRIAVSGAGAAAIACLDMYVRLGVRRENIAVADSRGVIYAGRDDPMEPHKAHYAVDTDARTLADIVRGADVFLGCSKGGLLTTEMLATMADRPVIFALANPDPEIPPADARAVRADCIIATGRSDHPNQVNNVLCFPFIFRGALDVGATSINDDMKLACVRAIAELAEAEQSDVVTAAYGGGEVAFGPEYIIPRPFDPRLILKIAPAVARAAMESGVATRPIADLDAYRERLTAFVYHSGNIMNPVFATAKQLPQRVLYAEGEEEVVLRAVQAIVDERLARPILVGRPEVVDYRIRRYGLRLSRDRDFELVNPESDPRYREVWSEYHQLMGRTRPAASAAVPDTDRRDAAAPWRRRCDAVRCRRSLPGSPRPRPECRRIAARRETVRGDERAAAAGSDALPVRHVHPHGADGAGARRGCPHGRRGDGEVRYRAAGCIAFALELRQQRRTVGAQDGRGLPSSPRDGTADRGRRRDAGRRRPLRAAAPAPAAGLAIDRGGEPARDAEPRRREHRIQPPQGDRRRGRHDRTGAARGRPPGAHPDARADRTPPRQHDGPGRCRGGDQRHAGRVRRSNERRPESP
jgi:malic enzyme